MTHNEIAKIIVGVALDVHRRLGPGLLESVYQEVLAYELKRKGLGIATQVPVPVEWNDVRLEVGFRADLVVEGKVMVELKSVEKVLPVFQKQLLTYLRLADKRLGLLINFGEELLKNGIVRIANKLEE